MQKLRGRRGGGSIHSNELEKLIEDYGDLVFSVCYRFTGHYFDAQDLAQETFLAAYRNLGQFDGSYPKAWLTKIAANKCLDYKKRAAARVSPTEDSFFATIEDAGGNPENLCLEEDVKRRFLILIRKLKEPYQSIAYDYFYEEKTAAEIALERGKNQKTVQTQIYRAKAQMKKLWKEVF